MPFTLACCHTHDIYFFLIDKWENELERAAKKAAQGIQKVYSYHQPPPQ